MQNISVVTGSDVDVEFDANPELVILAIDPAGTMSGDVSVEVYPEAQVSAFASASFQVGLINLKDNSIALVASAKGWYGVNYPYPKKIKVKFSGVVALPIQIVQKNA